MSALTEGLFEWFLDLFRKVGYAGIFAFMALESSFVPFPSEVVMGPAGVLAALGEMNVYVAVAAGTLGSIAGALFNYWLASKLGRPFFLKYGKWLLVKPATFERAEDFFRRHGEIATFICRLLPGIRQYVSLPAGLSRMHLGRFTLFTGLGAGLWCSVLAYFGVQIGRVYQSYLDSGESLMHAMKSRVGDLMLTVVLPALVGLVIIYALWHRFLRIPVGPGDEPEPSA